jgi:hypothetical protein
MCNQKWTIQKNWQQRVHKRKQTQNKNTDRVGWHIASSILMDGTLVFVYIVDIVHTLPVCYNGGITDIASSCEQKSRTTCG